jgi:TRAP-type C4-dicarboxylate transport system permease small subunit
MSEVFETALEGGEQRTGILIRTVDFLTNSAATVAAVITFGLMMLTAWNAIARFTVLPAVRGAIELSTVGIAIVGFLAIPYAVMKAQHVSTSILSDRLPTRVAKFLLIFCGLVVAAVVAWAAQVSFGQALRSFRVGEALMGISIVQVWPGRLAASAGLSLTFLQVSASLWLLMRNRRQIL